MTPSQIAADSGAQLAKRLIPEVEREVPIGDASWAFWIGFFGVFLACVLGSFNNEGKYRRFVSRLKEIQVSFAKETH